MQYGTGKGQFGLRLLTAFIAGLGMSVVGIINHHGPFDPARFVAVILLTPIAFLLLALMLQPLQTRVKLSQDEIEFSCLGRLWVRRVPLGEYRSVSIRVANPLVGSLGRVYFRTENYASLVGMSPLDVSLLTVELEQSRGRYCRKCGYDLRATPDRCPECGATGPAVKALENRPV